MEDKNVFVCENSNIRTMNLMSERNSEYGAKSKGGVIWSGNYKIR